MDGQLHAKDQSWFCVNINKIIDMKKHLILGLVWPIRSCVAFKKSMKGFKFALNSLIKVTNNKFNLTEAIQ